MANQVDPSRDFRAPVRLAPWPTIEAPNESALLSLHRLFRERGEVIAIFSLALCAMVAARLIRHYALGDVAHVQDEITYSLQARTYELGHVSSPVVTPRAAFNMWFVDDHTSRYGIFPPGWPALLAVGMRFGLENWVNPALHAFTIGVVGVFASEIGGRKHAMLAAAFYALSPQALLLAASFMSHSLVAACASVVVLQAWQHVRRAPPSMWRAVAAGVALALVACTRPLCMVVLLLLDVGVLVFRSFVERRLYARDAVAVFLPIALGVFLLLSYNRALLGSASTFPQNYYFNEHLPPDDSNFFRYHHGCNSLGFGRGCDFSIAEANHTLENALSNTGDNWQAWMRLAGGGPLIFLGALFAITRKKTRVLGLVTLALVAATTLAYSLYWHPGTCYGARFYHLALPLLIVAGAAGIAAVPQRNARVLLIAGFLGWNAFALSQGMRELSHDYWGTDDRFDVLAKHWDRGDAVVLVAFDEDDVKVPELTWTARIAGGTGWPMSMRANSALSVNDPNFHNPVIFAKYHPGLVDEVRAAWPERKLWMYVASPNKTQDTLVPLEDYVPTAEPDLVRPTENFNGFRVSEKRAPPRKHYSKLP